MGSLANPGDLTLTWQAGAVSLSLLALGAVLIGFPAAIFNATLTSNYDRITRFLPKRRRRREVPGWVLLAFGVCSAAAISTVVRSAAGWNRLTPIVFLATAAAALLSSVVVELPMWWHMRRKGVRTRAVRLYPGGFVIALAFAALTLVGGLEPGYVYGTLVGMTYLDLSQKDKVFHGRMVAIGYGALAAVGFSAWFLRVPFLTALRDDPGNTALAAATIALGAVFATGVQSAVFALLPLKFLSGNDVKTWNRVGWATLQLGLAAGFVFVFLSPANPKGSSTDGVVPAAILFGAFALFSFAFWGWFRFRPTPSVSEPGKA